MVSEQFTSGFFFSPAVQNVNGSCSCVTLL